MAVTLAGWTFSNPVEAVDAEFKLKALQSECSVTIDAAAVVSWAVHDSTPLTRQLSTRAGTDALGGAFWGLLFGVLLYAPLLERTLSAPGRTRSPSLSHLGIEDGFARSIRDRVVPGTSALLLVAGDAVVDRVHEDLRSAAVGLASTAMSSAQVDALREVFGSAGRSTVSTSSYGELPRPALG